MSLGRFSPWKAWTELFEEEAADEPRYDPVHLAAVFVAVQVAAGALFWLLWTAMVYEGGFMTGEGRLGNLAAFLLLAAVVEALRRLDRRAARKK